MSPAPLSDPRVSTLSENISDGRLRTHYLELINQLTRFHREVKLSCSDLEVRISFRGDLIARVVPYRELIHVRVGDAPGWEIRIRNEQACLETLDLATHLFLRRFALHPQPRE